MQPHEVIIKSAPQWLRPLVRLFLWMERSGIGWIWRWSQGVVPVLAALACIWVDVTPSASSIASAVALTVLAGVVGLAGSAAERFAIQERHRAHQRISRADMVGHLSVLLRSYCEYDESKESERAEFKEKVRGLQEQFLRQVVQVASDSASEPLLNLSANWSIKVEPDMFATKAYDKNSHTRPTGRHKYKIAKDVPGASKAFLTGCQSLVEDCRDHKVRHHFRADSWYVSIISIPVVIYPKDAQQVVGVVNIDCNRVGVLTKDTLSPICEACGYLAYLIGLCEAIAHEGWSK
jgi:hypothetical protein